MEWVEREFHATSSAVPNLTFVPLCRDHTKKQAYLVMGKKSKGDDGDKKALAVTFILPWSRSKVIFVL